MFLGRNAGCSGLLTWGLPQARYDPESTRRLFNDMASTYGRVNLLSSFGFTARWRNQAAFGLPLALAGSVVDLMSGMGELWRSLARGLPASARVLGVDLSPEMARRTPREWHFATEVHVGDVLAWEPPPASADVVVSSFGLKTFDREQQRHLANKVARVLKPGGTFSFVEVSALCQLFTAGRTRRCAGLLFLRLRDGSNGHQAATRFVEPRPD